jgi:anti-sigma regulatory factor (Ser/Thr protein kinase)
MDLTDCEPSVLKRIRDEIAARFADTDEVHLGDVTLAAVELVTNAFEHGDGPRRFELRRTTMPCLFELTVEDGSTTEPVVGRSRFGEQAYRGRGLRLVDGLAKAWGFTVDEGQGTKTVWATIPCPDAD